jgi:hypothetical protein
MPRIIEAEQQAEAARAARIAAAATAAAAGTASSGSTGRDIMDRAALGQQQQQQQQQQRAAASESLAAMGFPPNWAQKALDVSTLCWCVREILIHVYVCIANGVIIFSSKYHCLVLLQHT